MAENLPIDIHLNKLLEWLISRRHCNRNFQSYLDGIRSRLTEAIQDMPAHDKITELLSGNLLNYYTCRQIVEILKETEADTKNIFGYYSSKRMKDWQDIISSYEKDNLYLAEGALILSRNVSYEIPSIRKAIQKLQNQEADFVRKSADFQKQSVSIRNQHAAAAAKLGIKGENPCKELVQSLTELKTIVANVTAELPKLKDAKHYYYEFVKFMNKIEKLECTPLLNYLSSKGNTTYYEYRTGNEPVKIEEEVIEFPEDNKENENDDQIDFGDDTASSSTTNGNGDFVHISRDDCIQAEDNIIWEIESTEVSMIESPADGIARGNDALTVMEHPVTRNNFINELYELEGFFEQRILDSKGESQVISENQLQDSAQLFQLTSADQLAGYLETARNILQMLTNEKTTILFMMKDDRKYIEKTAEKLNNIFEGIDKSLIKSSLMREKAAESKSEYEKLGPELNALVDTTRKLQRNIEDAISTKYKNRPVNIMGGVQSLQL